MMSLRVSAPGRDMRKLVRTPEKMSAHCVSAHVGSSCQDNLSMQVCAKSQDTALKHQQSQSIIACVIWKNKPVHEATHFRPLAQMLRRVAVAGRLQNSRN